MALAFQKGFEGRQRLRRQARQVHRRDGLIAFLQEHAQHLPRQLIGQLHNAIRRTTYLRFAEALPRPRLVHARREAELLAQLHRRAHDRVLRPHAPGRLQGLVAAGRPRRVDAFPGGKDRSARDGPQAGGSVEIRA